jgi:general secretion pathway protein G
MRQRKPAERRTARAFTLIEMMAVLVIIGLIVGLGVPKVLQAIDNAKVTTAQAQTKILYQAVQRFYQDQNRYPADSEGLSALIIRPTDATTWPPGGYVDMRRIPLDPWKHNYAFRVIKDNEGNEQAEVISYGRDGQEGGTGLDADIINGETITPDMATATGGVVQPMGGGTQ